MARCLGARGWPICLRDSKMHRGVGTATTPAMNRILAVALTLGAIWSFYGNCTLVLIVWYSGVEQEVTIRDWLDLGIQAAVNVGAIALVWRLARTRRVATVDHATG